jgi:hypothetical protein
MIRLLDVRITEYKPRTGKKNEKKKKNGRRVNTKIQKYPTAATRIIINRIVPLCFACSETARIASSQAAQYDCQWIWKVAICNRGMMIASYVCGTFGPINHHSKSHLVAEYRSFRPEMAVVCA